LESKTADLTAAFTETQGAVKASSLMPKGALLRRLFIVQRKALAGRAVPKKAYGDHEGIQTPFAIVRE